MDSKAYFEKVIKKVRILHYDVNGYVLYVKRK